jgi:hypothetical protein
MRLLTTPELAKLKFLTWFLSKKLPLPNAQDASKLHQTNAPLFSNFLSADHKELMEIKLLITLF